LEDEIIPYVDAAMQRLVFLLQNSNKQDVQEMAISGISAIAASSEVSFANHYPVCQSPSFDTNQPVRES
jgi:hypothetical protein